MVLPSCGTRFSWYAQIAGNCGLNLAARSNMLSGWRKLLCSLVIPATYRKGKKQQQSDK
jgi:hypothetical protein